MLELDIRGERGEVTGKVEFDDSVLGSAVRPRLVHQVVVAYMANKRQGTSSAKTRAEVKGSGKKLWRQKGTGRARVGDRRGALRVGGGVAHPPKPRSFRQKLTKSMRRQALRSALLSKFRDNEVTIIETPKFDAPKTKELVGMLKALELDIGGKDSCLLLTREADLNIWKSARNVPRLRTLPMRNLNALEVLSHDRIVLTRDVVENLPDMLRQREVTR